MKEMLFMFSIGLLIVVLVNDLVKSVNGDQKK